MKHYHATCKATKETFHFDALNMDDALHWVINHLDCSRCWNIECITGRTTNYSE